MAKQTAPASPQLTLGTINPFKRSWFATQKLFSVNPKTLFLVLVISLVCLCAVAVAAVFMFVMFVSITTYFPDSGLFGAQLQTMFNLEPPTNTINIVPAILLFILALAASLALWTFIAAMVQKVAIESIRGAHIAIGSVVQTAFQKLPRLLLVSLMQLGVMLLLFAGALFLVYAATQELFSGHPSPVITAISFAGFAALCIVAVYINVRWFLYAAMSVIDTNKTARQAVLSSGQLVSNAPGYTVGLLLIAIAVSSVFEVLSAGLQQLDGLGIMAIVLSLLGSLLLLGILAVGYVDTTNAAKEKVVLRASKGTLVLAILAAIIMVAVSGAANPSDQPYGPETPMPGPEYIKPFNNSVNET